jgi:FkbM family methyltransferase
MVAVDIGANIGCYSLLLAQYVGDKGYVWVFEPDPGNFAMLKRNLKENNCTNIKAVNSAVGARSERRDLYLSRSHNGDHRLYPQDGRRSTLPVDVVALDEFFSVTDRIDLIKMDIQGAEGLALAGMNRILRDNSQLTILMEFWPTGLTQAGFVPGQLLTDLQAMGFALELIDERKGRLVKIEHVSEFVDSLSPGQYVNLLARTASGLRSACYAATGANDPGKTLSAAGLSGVVFNRGGGPAGHDRTYPGAGLRRGIFEGVHPRLVDLGAFWLPGDQRCAGWPGTPLCEWRFTGYCNDECLPSPAPSPAILYRSSPVCPAGRRYGDDRTVADALVTVDLQPPASRAV